jgi:prevent-host-death family protein
MTLATVAQVKNQLSKYLARAKRTREPIIVTHHGKPYALIQPISERDLETLDWKRLADRQLREAWAGEDDALYDYL